MNTRHPALNLPCIFLLTTLLTFFIASSAAGETKEVETSLSLEPAEKKTIRLKSLPLGAGIHIEATSTSPVMLLLLDEAGYTSYVKPVAAPLFRGMVIDRLSFSVTIPRSDNYYLVLDNATGKSTCSVQLRIEASAGHAGTEGSQETFSLLQKDFSQKLQLLVTKLQQLFVFEPFKVHAKDCRRSGSSGNRDEVIFCVDKMQALYNDIGDREQATDLLIFAFFHETGHMFLNQWAYPFADNGTIADEFATIMLQLSQQEERLQTVIEYLSEESQAADALNSLFMDTRHQNVINRAETIRNCKADSTKARRWFKFLLPHIQIPLLEKLLESPTPQIDPQLIEQEILRRALKS